MMRLFMLINRNYYRLFFLGLLVLYFAESVGQPESVKDIWAARCGAIAGMVSLLGIHELSKKMERRDVTSISVVRELDPLDSLKHSVEKLEAHAARSEASES